MITYLFTSILLSLLGAAIYWAVRGYASPIQRKRLIYTLLAGSLLLPLFSVHTQPPILKPTPHIRPLHFGARVDHSNVQQYCRCESPDYSHWIEYRANAHYNFLLEYKHWVGYGIAIAIGAVLLLLGVQLLYLRHLVNRSQSLPHTYRNESFILLKPHRPIGIGAFWLGKSYIVWEEPLSGLTTEEREAIFAHELSHLKQQNTLEKACFRLLQCLWFANPVFYFLRKELDLLSEFIADQAGSNSLGGVKAYAALLIKLKTLQASPAVSPLTGSVLRLRIEQLVQPAPIKPAYAWLALPIILSLQMLIVTPLKAQVSTTLKDLETYEEIYEHAPSQPEVIYCPDCETVCTPEE